MDIPYDFKEGLSWWSRNVQGINRIRNRLFVMKIFTDASKTDWETSCNGQTGQRGFWFLQECLSSQSPSLALNVLRTIQQQLHMLIEWRVPYINSLIIQLARYGNGTSKELYGFSPLMLLILSQHNLVFPRLTLLHFFALKCKMC